MTAAQDGYLAADELVTWLADNIQTTQASMPTLLAKDIEKLDEDDIQTLMELIAIRDVTARRLVLTRLAQMPKDCAKPVVDLMADGTPRSATFCTQAAARVEGTGRRNRSLETRKHPCQGRL